MGLSASSLGVFVFLLPGLFLRWFIYQGSVVKRAIVSANPLFAVLSIVFFALSVHVVAGMGLVAGCALARACANGLARGRAQLVGSEAAGEGPLADVLLAHPWALVVYLVFAVAVAFGLAKLFTWAAGKHGPAARLLYGPLAAVAKAGHVEMLTCFVLTRVGHENRQVIYSGFPEEIGLKDGSKIDYLVLRAPEKFYLRKTRQTPQSTLNRARKLSQPYARGVLFVAGGQIENVYFESWSF